MKIGILGDLHGLNTWKQFTIENPDMGMWIFLGDYLDSYSHKDEQIINNFLDIIQFKKDNPDKVILLLGNHEISYFENQMCSGYRVGMAPIVNSIYKDNKDLFQIAYQYKNYLFTHAGVSKKWYNWAKNVFLDVEEKFHPEDFADALNIISKTSSSGCLYSVGRIRGGSSFGGPLWADRNETMEGIIPGFNQIVGHTPHKEITKVTKFMGTELEDRSITYCDNLQTSKEFLTLSI